MHIHVPDPAYTDTAQSRARFRLAAKIAFGFVALLWFIHWVNSSLDLDPYLSGIRPREWAGLPGILFAPLVHGSFEHLVANSPPLLVLGTTMLFLYPNSAVRTLPAIYLGTNIAVWVFGRESVHFGASGLVYGLLSHIFVAGLLRRDRRAIAACLAVCFLYGSLVWGLLPVPEGVSWETHLAAALIGVATAIASRRLDVLPRKHYTWEGENDENDEGSLRP